MLSSPRASAGLVLALVPVLGCASSRVRSPEPNEGRAPVAVAAPAPAASVAPPPTPPARPGPATAQDAPSSGSAPLWPAVTATIEDARTQAEHRVLGSRELSEPPAPSAPRPAGDSDVHAAARPLGHLVPIENDQALSHFHAALARLAAGDPDTTKVRILAYGASHTEADVYPGYLRAYLQERFGDGGRGFVLLGRVNRWHRMLDLKAHHHALEVHYARSKHDVNDEPLGLFGAALIGRTADGYAEIETPADSPNTELELQYYAQPGGGSVRIVVDEKLVARVATGAAAAHAGYYPFEIAPGAHNVRVKLVGDGPVRLYGVVAETREPGVVLDTLGIGGARMADALRWQEQAWADAVRHRHPHLRTFAYGTNEAFDGVGSIERYSDGVRQVIERLRRAAPEASCLFIAPFDVEQSARAHLIAIVDAQRRLASELGCGFWNGYAFMGGKGAIRVWASVKPPLATNDHIHLTRRGYVRAAVAIGDALMRRYDLGRAQRARAGVATAPASSGTSSAASAL